VQNRFAKMLRGEGSRDLSPKFRTMNSMRFPANLARWRSRYEEDAIHRRTDHWRHQGA